MEYFSLTDIGLVRAKNQDSYITIYNENRDFLVIVCDGIGGNKAGEVASSEICRYFAKIFPLNKGFKDAEEVITYLKYHVRIASDYVYDMSRANKDYEGMGTTITGILFSELGTFAINAGDSRVYGINEEMHQLTTDHTLVNELLARKLITPEEAVNHPKKHYVTKFLGVFEGASADVYQIFDRYQYYLVCSDGLHGYVNDAEMVNFISDKTLTLAQKSSQLMQSALRAGGYDNITFVLVRLDAGDIYGN